MTISTATGKIQNDIKDIGNLWISYNYNKIGLMRTYMTDKQNEEQKSRQRSLHYSLLRVISDIYPTVDKITIRYKQIYRSAFGTSEYENEQKYTSSSRNNFLVKCLNRECTSIGYDLRDEVEDMIYSRESSREGNIDCNGSEAPDHLYQSCGSSLHYYIQITFKN